MATRILLVDDDPKIVPLLQRGLAYEGFDVYTAMDGESGLAAVRQHRPHIVLLDIAMPGPDGGQPFRGYLTAPHRRLTAVSVRRGRPHPQPPPPSTRLGPWGSQPNH